MDTTWALLEQQKYAQQRRTILPAMRRIFPFFVPFFSLLSFNIRKLIDKPNWWSSFHGDSFKPMTRVRKAAAMLQFRDKIFVFMNTSWKNLGSSTIFGRLITFTYPLNFQKNKLLNWSNHTGADWIYVLFQNCGHDSRGCEIRQVIVWQRKKANGNAASNHVNGWISFDKLNQEKCTQHDIHQ